MSIVSFIFPYDKVIDIGCDHGLLDVYLTVNKKCVCRACDVNKSIINRARNNFIKYGVLDQIDLFVGNGFDDLHICSDETIILSGMGTSTILKILSVNKTNRIICQTNTDLYDLRVGVSSMGYYINRESIVFDNNRYYVTIEFIKGKKNYSYEEYLLGPILLNDKGDLFQKYITNMYEKNIKGYNKAKEFNNNLSDFDKLVNTLKKYI